MRAERDGFRDGRVSKAWPMALGINGILLKSLCPSPIGLSYKCLKIPN